MYAAEYATDHPDRPAFIMASTGEAVDLRRRSKRAATNSPTCWPRTGSVRSITTRSSWRTTTATSRRAAPVNARGHYYTCVNSYLTAEEMAYIVNNSESKVVDHLGRETRRRACSARRLPRRVTRARRRRHGRPDRRPCARLRGSDRRAPDDADRTRSCSARRCSTRRVPRDDRRGSSARCPSSRRRRYFPCSRSSANLWHYREDMVYLSPAPLYHSAPQAAVNLTIRKGGTVVIMERFDPIDYLRLIEQYQVTHTQLVPTMFSRMLKLPVEERERFDLSSLEIAVHAAAPCPVPVKEADDRVVGPDHPRVLRRDRRPRVHGLQQRGVAGPQGHRRQGRCSATSTSSTTT